MSRSTRSTVGTLSAVGVLFLAACGSSTSPNTPAPRVAMSYSDFETAVNTGPRRIEVKLLPGTLVAREIEAEADDNEEKIESQVTAIDAANGTITLSLGGIVVSYTGSTRFRTPSDSRVSRAAWESAISSALAGGQQPPIEARRNAPATPQDPTDGAFTANDLRLADRTDEPSIEIYVDSDNVVPNPAQPPVAFLKVLGITIDITSSTEVFEGNPDGQGTSSEFTGSVTAVDVSGGTITLTGGVVVTVGSLSFDPTGDLFSLQATADAVTAGQLVRAEGRGSVTTAGPPAAYSATAIKVEVDN
jgi:hypothetical protein